MKTELNKIYILIGFIFLNVQLFAQCYSTDVTNITRTDNGNTTCTVEFDIEVTNNSCAGDMEELTLNFVASGILFGVELVDLDGDGNVTENFTMNFTTPLGTTESETFNMNITSNTFKRSGLFSSECWDAGLFFFSENDVILPVELLEFNIESLKDQNELSWSTAMELNNSHFEIEHSVDGEHFSKIGRIEGEGTTNDVQDYAFVDRLPVNGMNYYRLKQVDFNGEFYYSTTIYSNNIDGNDALRIYPTPAENHLSIYLPQLKDENASMVLSDIFGNIIIEKELENSVQQSLNISSLTSGNYLIKITTDTEVYTSIFTKK